MLKNLYFWQQIIFKKHKNNKTNTLICHVG